jgi:flagellar biosynthesis/type III secretory pathway chaperone
MGLFDMTNASDALEDLLDREKSAVLDGRFDILDRLAAEKERLVGLVARGGAAPQALARLKEASDRNGRLLGAMRDGVVAAQNRLKSMRAPAAPLQTYDASGHKTAMPGLRKAGGHRA